jgi:serine/threonine-protein kinase
MSECSSCGSSVPTDAQFCTQCGTAVSGDPTNAATQHSSSRSTKSQDQLLEALREATLGEYEVLTELGRGGMAVVYLAEDLALGRKVAIKVMSPELRLMGEQVVERFNREAKTAAKLSHPHIIPIYAVQERNDLTFFVMKFIQGRSLEHVMREEDRLPAAVVQTILSQVGSALDYADRNGVIHRDVKPGNIMLDEEGWAVVTDFGIAKAVEADGLTMTGAALGTPSYMSPEQCAGLGITGAADQYSLGVLAFEMLSGELPFEGESAMTVMYRHTHEPPPPITDVWPDCPPDLAEAVMRMLAKKPEDRWPSVAEAIGAIAAVQPVNDSAVRTQMVTMVKRASNQSLLAQFHTPRTPITAGMGRSRARAIGSASGQVTPDTAAVAVAPPPAEGGKRRSLAWLVAVPLVGVAAAAGWFLRPTATTIEPTPAAPQVAEPPPASATPASMVTSLAVEPGTAALTVGQAQSLTAIPRDSFGAALATAAVEWTSSNTGVASVSPEGIVTARAAGFAQLTARVSGHSATVGITVNAPPRTQPAAPAAVASVGVSPSSPTLSVGQDVRLQATPLDAAGTALANRAATWSTSDESVAAVSAAGLVTGGRAGSAEITVTIGGRSATAAVRVTAIPVASVRITPSSRSIQSGETLRLTAVTLSADGAELPGRAISWSTSSDIFLVSSAGVVTGVAAGTATVTATSESRTATATITVTAPPTPETPAPDPARDRQQIEAALQAYARAVESRDLDELRRVYPGLTRQQADAWRGFFDSVNDLSFTLTTTSVETDGDTATTAVDALQEFRTNRQERRSFTFRATLERTANGWRITRIQ